MISFLSEVLNHVKGTNQAISIYTVRQEFSSVTLYDCGFLGPLSGNFYLFRTSGQCLLGQNIRAAETCIATYQTHSLCPKSASSVLLATSL